VGYLLLKVLGGFDSHGIGTPPDTLAVLAFSRNTTRSSHALNGYEPMGMGYLIN
jgi:hypothetical protein